MPWSKTLGRVFHYRACETEYLIFFDHVHDQAGSTSISFIVIC
jgi:hypothetical protein